MTLLGRDICRSGGAKGADLAWGSRATQAGHAVIHWSFAGHRSPVETYDLTSAQLDAAIPKLIRANQTLNRSVPRRGFVRNLLARNWYQVESAERVYAISQINHGMVEGGTAWACALFIDRHNGLPCPCYVFDQERVQWYCWKGHWAPVEAPPAPDGVYAAIGTRKLNDAGLAAIQGIYE